MCWLRPGLLLPVRDFQFVACLIPTYLLSKKNLSVVGMRFVSTAPWFGDVLGNLLGGILSDTLLDKRRKLGMLLSAFSTSVMMLCMLYVPDNLVLCALLLFMTVCC
ncbi:MAG: hypothetical protein ACSLEN_05790 [Candidatus Malihini olakiniferum]